MEKRDKYWDIFKGIGIFLVVWGHAGVPWISWAYIWNYFHLAIFFFSAGALYKDKYSLPNENEPFPPVAFAMKKWRSIFFPCICYVVTYILLHNVFIFLNIYSSVQGINGIYPKTAFTAAEIIYYVLQAILTSNYAVELSGAMWCVYPLIVAEVLFCGIRWISFSVKGLFKTSFQNVSKGITILLSTFGGIAGIFMISHSYTLPWRSDIAFLMLPIVVAGFYFKKVKVNLFGIGISMAVILSAYINGMEISYAAGIATYPWAFYFCTFSGLVVTSFLTHLIERKGGILTDFFSIIGRESLHIMAMHFLAFKAINCIDVLVNQKEAYFIAQFPTSNLSWWYLYLTVGITIPTVIVRGVRKLAKRKRNFKTLQENDKGGLST